MTLEKHVIDTMKEWQLKIGSLDSGIRLYYPKLSICRYLHTDVSIDNQILCKNAECYLIEKAEYLSSVKVTAQGDRFCIMVGKEACDHVEKEIPEPEFLSEFLKVLKKQDIHSIVDFFEKYANDNETSVYIQKQEEADGKETVLYFADENVEPYVYCIDQNAFGITYHRFTKEDYRDLE